MQKKVAIHTRDKQIQQRYIIAVVVLIILVLAVLVIFTIKPFSPERSVVAYCETLQQHKAEYGETDDYGILAERYAKLERVAPEDIHNDVARLQAAFETVHNDPSQAMTTGLGALDSGNRVEVWEKENCNN